MRDRRVLLVPPTRRDADVTERVLATAGITTSICALRQLQAEIQEGAAAVLLTEDALESADAAFLWAQLDEQHEWSDLPFVVLARSGSPSLALEQLQAVTSVTLLERPVLIRTLVSAVQMAVRARSRQYQVRDLLASERRARETADRANRAKDRFLAVLSHELRTPLTPVVYAVASLQRELAGQTEQRRSLDRRLPASLDMIRRNIALETKLIDDLLDLSRVAQGKLQLQYDVVDMHERLADTLAMVESDARAKRLSIVTRLDAFAHELVADAARMHQVLWNLAKNAIKFTPSGGTITFRSWNEDDVFKLSCSDTGVGIAPDALQRIFEAFEQAGEETTRVGGLGLGLAISRSLLEAHGGAIHASSGGPGSGATFTVALPRARTKSPRAATTLPAPARAAAVRLAILVVEDHLDTAEALYESLTASGHAVQLANDVGGALRIAQVRPFDVLVSDIGLPDGSGLDLILQLPRRPRLGAIALSGFGMDEDVRRSRAAGFARHLTKPVDILELERAIAELASAQDVGGAGRDTGR